jgi:hypothetical protein
VRRGDRDPKANLSDLSFLNEIPDPVPPGANERRPDDRLRHPPGDAPTRSVSGRRRTAALCVSLAWLCTHLAIYGIRQDFAQLSAAYIAAQMVLPFVFAAACLIVALAPGKLGLGVGVGLVSVMALLGPASYWVFALGMPMPHASGPDALGFWLGSLLCLDITLAWAAAPLLLVALSLRRAFAAHAAGRSALVGAGLGLLSGAAINLHCPNVDPWHMLTGHGIAVALAVWVGALIVVRWTRA